MAVANRVRETRRVAGQFDWLHSFQHHVHPSLEVQAGVDPAHSDFADRRVPVSPLHHGRGGGTQTPVDAVLETAALAAELHLFRTPPNKKAAAVDPGRLADLGLVVSRFKTSTSALRRR